MKYLNNKSWLQITREERFFCAQLFFELRNNPTPFLHHLNQTDKKYEVGFEVCLYRDLMKERGLSIRNSPYPQKRTFDLAFFAEDEIIIIEAKAQQGFHTEQLEDFMKDKELIPKLLGPNCKVSVKIIGIYSSLYQPSAKTVSSFDKKVVTWKELSTLYPSSEEIFNQADSSFSKKIPNCS